MRYNNQVKEKTNGISPALVGIILYLTVHGISVFANNFTRGPFVQSTTTNSVQIAWNTFEPTGSWVEYGLSKDLSSKITSENFGTNHWVRLSQLKPATQYYYRVICTNKQDTLISTLETFTTFKESGPISFSVISDSGQNSIVEVPLIQMSLTTNIIQLKPDLVTHLGDIVGSDFKFSTIQSQFFNIFQPAIKNIPFFFAVGNHDLFPATGSVIGLNATEFQKAFYLPTNSMDGTSRYYSFDHGDVHFVFLFNPWFYFYVFDNKTDQYRWLTNDLAKSSKPWKLLFFHAPIATTSVHAPDDYNYNDIPDQFELMNVVAPLAELYGVQMVFSGHDHSLHRYAPTQGLHSCVAAGGGQSMYYLYAVIPSLSKFWQRYHCLNVGITNSTMTLNAYDTNGVCFDSWTVQKSLPSRQIYQATWHTPEFAISEANNGDGNVFSQVFDFEGQPIYPRSGQFSNLGRVFVNNDEKNLYIGMDQVMIQNDNNLLLFVESSKIQGVTTMAGLGNGKIDPQGEGADGLDCLENLSFTNFTPCVGCLLGDEYADRQYRSFVRTNLALDIGQGVFRLNSTLEDLPGARIQQFNLSPQITESAVLLSNHSYEQNADYIQVSIPLKELGDLQPGNTIKIAAVVGGKTYDLKSQTRHIDTSALGYSLSGSGMLPVSVEGISVQLALNPQADSDRDGLLDWQEYLAGTDPNNPHSVLKVSIEGSSLEQIQLVWTTIPGKQYQLETSDHLFGRYAPVEDPTFPRVAHTDRDVHVFKPMQNPSAFARFFRIRVITDRP